jgi:hypothetical protein
MIKFIREWTVDLHACIRMYGYYMSSQVNEAGVKTYQILTCGSWAEPLSAFAEPQRLTFPRLATPWIKAGLGWPGAYAGYGEADQIFIEARLGVGNSPATPK